ncbi:MAG: Gfo/Idh/MocA family protein [Candidatus Hydrogenedentota bacterium]
MNKRTMERRTFLKAGAALGAGWTALSYSRVAGANERVNLAFIGVGGMGGSNLAIISGRRNPDYAPHAERVTGAHIAALCDVDLRREGPRSPTPAEAFDAYPDAAKYHDYRKMLDEMERDIDAVVVSTPNHSHAPASVTAMRMGKHVYCEKPGAHSVYEARVMADVAREQGVATQLGTQVHSSENFRRVVELIQAGAIGEVTACHIWLRSGTPSTGRPVDTPSVPADLHWDLWLGPAPRRPYHPTYIPTQWHRWWDFGGGIQLGNMGCHYMDLPFWALDLRHPSTIEADGPEPHPETAPGRLHLRWIFDRGEEKPPITLTWTHGGEPRAVFAEQDFPEWTWGVFVGDKGMLLANYSQHQLWPPEDFEGYEPPEPSIPPSVGHRQEWINACKGEGEPLSHFGYSMAISETVLLGNVAYRSGRKLEWNAQQFTIDNAHEAEGFLQRGYRPGWTL